MDPRNPVAGLATRCFTLLFVLGTSMAFGQTVNWSTKVVKTGTDEAEIQFIAEIPSGWHIYSKAVDGTTGPLPTNINLQPVSGNFQAEGNVTESSHVISKYEQAFETSVSYFENKAIFVQKIKYTNTEPVKMKAVIEYMMCNSSECRPPDEIVLPLTVE